MIILGIDPGYGTIGYGVVRFDNMKFTAIQYGAAKTAPGTPMHLRLCEIHDDICTLLWIRSTQMRFRSRSFFFKEHHDRHSGRASTRRYPARARAKGPASGFVYAEPGQNGGGRLWQRRKKQMMEMTKSILHLTKLPRPDDAADALALAICHGHSRNAIRYEGLFDVLLCRGNGRAPSDRACRNRLRRCGICLPCFAEHDRQVEKSAPARVC